MNAGVRVEGLNELVRSSRRVDKDLPKQMRVIHLKVGAPVAARAEALSPRLTNRLSGSVKATATQRVAQVRAGGARVPYAGVIHWGWPAHNIEPQKFLLEAISASHAEVLQIYELEMERFVERTWESI